MKITPRLLQAREEEHGLYFIDYGRMSSVDDGRRTFYNVSDWYDTLRNLRKRGAKLHKILPNVFGCTLKGFGAGHDIQHNRSQTV